MQLTIEIPNQPLYDKILWLLNKFKSDGVKIVTTIPKIKRDDSIEESSINSIEHFKRLQGVGKELYVDTDK